MSIHNSLRLPLAGLIALALFGTASAAAARTPSPQAQSPNSTQQFYPGTKSSATYPIHDGTLTVNAGMPDHVKNYGPPPPFKTLDVNHDGRISEAEAQVYPPLDSDFLYASNGGKYITRAQYEKWAKDLQ